MLNERDKQRQKRHRKRFEAKIDPSAIVVAFNNHCLNADLFSLIYSMLSELPDHIRFKTHLYGIDSGDFAHDFTDLGTKTFVDYSVPLHYVKIDGQYELSDHYHAIDILIVTDDNEPGLTTVKSALTAGCSVVTNTKNSDKINLNIKERLRISDRQCPMELSKHIAALATQRRKFDCALAS